jgi:methyl coenzyme M reductase alpha subunit
VSTRNISVNQKHTVYTVMALDESPTTLEDYYPQTTQQRYAIRLGTATAGTAMTCAEAIACMQAGVTAMQSLA